MLANKNQPMVASSDAIILAKGLHDIASAIREFTLAMNQEPGEPQEQPETYLDGKGI